MQKHSPKCFCVLLAFWFLAFAALFVTSQGAADVLLKPLEGKQEPDIALVFFQGAGIPADRYISVCNEIQKAVPYRLWVGIPNVLFDYAFEPLMPAAVSKIFSELEKAGMPSNADLFFGGHSLGGAMLPFYIEENKVDCKGVLLFGAFFTRGFYPVADTFPAPTLTVGGTLDGLTRITRIAEAYYHQIIKATDFANVSAMFPVVEIEGLSHMQFASGEPPLNVRDRDLIPSVSYADAHRMIGAVSSDFIRVRMNVSDAEAMESLSQHVKDTGKIVAPIVEAFEMEGYYHFLPPCYQAAKGATCTKGSPWVQKVAAPSISGIGPGVLVDNDTFEDLSLLKTGYPVLENKCPPGTRCTLRTATVSENTYNVFEYFDLGYYPESANEIRATMKSRQSAQEAYLNKRVNFQSSDYGSSLCKAINANAYHWALSRAGNFASDHFAKFGEPFTFGQDKLIDSTTYGPQEWILEPLEFNSKQSEGVTSVEVVSPAFVTPLRGDIFPDEAGMHYCKLLSPARAIEWIYVDGLRLHGSLESIAKKDNSTNQLFLAPNSIPPGSVRLGLIFVGRSDVELSAYTELVQELQAVSAASSPSVAIFAVLERFTQGGILETSVAQLQRSYRVEHIFFFGHSMTEGGVSVQNYLRKNSSAASGLILVSSFLQRTQRPSVRECLAKAKYQPKASLEYPLGYLKSGLHNCFGPNLIDFPVPTLTISGDLDGIVRITRIGEAYYTQQVLEKNSTLKALFPVLVVQGMNHGAILANGDRSLPPSVRKNDLFSEISPEEARKTVAQSVISFMRSRLGLKAATHYSSSSTQAANTPVFFKPIVEAFANLESNWFYTGQDEEHGSSAWSAQAQQWMAEPMPRPFTWHSNNQFHLCSDAEFIPPYYRHEHRAEIQADPAVSFLNTSTVAQQRFIEITVEQAGAGFNGYEIIKEEKLNILKVIEDDGSTYESTIELATKLASRQKVFKLSGFASPQSLDDGNRCANINQRAYDWAKNNSSPSAMRRFQKYGVPLAMGPDLSPELDAGPWWIWTYLKYTPKNGTMEVSSYKAFFPLDSNPYGAGNHYCKLLSPARALEWIYIDSLRGSPAS